jgi:hypothetical protein
MENEFWKVHKVKVFFPIEFFLLTILASCTHYEFKRKFPPGRSSSLKNSLESAVGIYLSVLAGMYIYVLTMSLEPFRCFQQVDGSFTLVASPNYDCYDREWNHNKGFIIFGVLHIVAIPVAIAFLLFWGKKNVSENRFFRIFGLLTNQNKDKYYWWTLFLMMKKTLLVFVVDLTNNLTTPLRSLLVLIILLSAMFLETLVNPRRNEIFSSRLVAFAYVYLFVFCSNLESQMVLLPNTSFVGPSFDF